MIRAAGGGLAGHRLQQRVDVMSSAVLIESRLQYIEN
jgi:hypothetical protein